MPYKSHKLYIATDNSYKDIFSGTILPWTILPGHICPLTQIVFDSILLTFKDGVKLSQEE